MMFVICCKASSNNSLQQTHTLVLNTLISSATGGPTARSGLLKQHDEDDVEQLMMWSRP